MRRLSENSLIAEYLAPLASHPGAFGLKDDAALLTALPSSGLVVTADGLVAGVHFFEDDDPGDVAYKALAVNVSDLAAKAAKPLAYTLTLALADAPDEGWATRFTAGLRRGGDRFGIALIGGDTVSARGAWWLSITAFGEASSRGMVPRGGARPGDILYVSGTLGDSAFGLAIRRNPDRFGWLDETSRDYLRGRYLYPQPRLELTAALSRYGSAAMDISDGLALDLSRMCTASGVSAKVQIDTLPLSEAARRIANANPEAIRTILTGGDDYEILAAVPGESARDFEAAGQEAGIALTAAGRVLPGAEGPKFLTAREEELPLSVLGFEHFTSGSDKPLRAGLHGRATYNPKSGS
jgi:thiamine-monophosphate kinase